MRKLVVRMIEATVIWSVPFDHNPDHNHDVNTVKGMDRISQKHPFIKIKQIVRTLKSYNKHP